MTKQFHAEIENLKRRLLYLSAEVEESVRRAVAAIEERDDKAAEKVIAGDHTIDKLEVAIEEECLKILALHQPVAIDLRLLITILKINNDLERIGDLAVNLAERAAFLAGKPKVSPPFDFPTMANKAAAMLKKSLDALVNADAKLAREVLASDDEVDALNRVMYLQVQQGIREHPEQLESLTHLLSASRHIERIADHATNIAEDIIYMLEGDIIRHRTEDYRKELRVPS